MDKKIKDYRASKLAKSGYEVPQAILPDNNDLKKFDRQYDPDNNTGLGLLYIDKNTTIVTDETVGKKNINLLTQDMFYKNSPIGRVPNTNTVFVIRYDYDLNDPEGSNPITIPEGSVLQFDGGSINNGKIILNNASVQSEKECFGEDLIVSGKVLEEASPEWFTGSDADKIKRAIDAFGVVKLAARTYTIDKQIVIDHSFCLKGSGFNDFFGSWSQSTLVATGQIGSILYIAKAEDSPYYSSVTIENVGFRCYNKTGNSYNKDVDGILFRTPNGPSRPFVVRNCSFKCLRRGIWIDNDAANPSIETSVSNILIDSNVLSLNHWGLYATGHLSVGRCIITNNTLDQNTTGNDPELAGSAGGICFYDDSTYTYDGNDYKYYQCRDYLEIKNNILEDEHTAYKLKVQCCLVNIIGNHYENVSYATILGDRSLRSIVNLDGNMVTSNTAGLRYSIFNCDVNFSDYERNSNAKYYLQNVYVTGKYKGSNISVDNGAFGANFAEGTSYSTPSVSPVKTMSVNAPVRTEDDRILHRIPAAGSAFAWGSSLDVDSTKYYAIVFNTYSPERGVFLINIGPDAGPLIQEGVVPIRRGYSRNMFILKKSASASYSGPFRIKEGTTDGILVSDILIYELDSYPSKLIGLDWVKGADINPVISYTGASKYDAITQKNLIYNGTAWVDGNGYLPAMSRGTTENRPTNIVGFGTKGYTYYDTTISKLIVHNSKRGAYTKIVSDSGTKVVYSGNNPFTTGKEYNMQFTQVKSNESIELRISKYASTTDPEYSRDQDIIIAPTPQTTAATRYSPDFIAPDSTVYPYIHCYQSGTSGGSVRFYNYVLHEDIWQELDGAIAGVARKGTTEERPAGSDVYVGFQYFDTTLGIPIYVSAISSGVATWVKYDGTNPDV